MGRLLQKGKFSLEWSAADGGLASSFFSEWPDDPMQNVFLPIFERRVIGGPVVPDISRSELPAGDGVKSRYNELFLVSKYGTQVEGEQFIFDDSGYDGY